jgi:hypothetical protein
MTQLSESSGLRQIVARQDGSTRAITSSKTICYNAETFGNIPRLMVPAFVGLTDVTYAALLDCVLLTTHETPRPFNDALFSLMMHEIQMNRPAGGRLDSRETRTLRSNEILVASFNPPRRLGLHCGIGVTARWRCYACQCGRTHKQRAMMISMVPVLAMDQAHRVARKVA